MGVGGMDSLHIQNHNAASLIQFCQFSFWGKARLDAIKVGAQARPVQHATQLMKSDMDGSGWYSFLRSQNHSAASLIQFWQFVFWGKARLYAMKGAAEARAVLRASKLMKSEVDVGGWYGFPTHSESQSSFSHPIQAIFVLGKG